MSRTGMHELTCVGALMVMSASAGHALGTSPSDEELVALEALKGRISGQIVWESNRTGHWELYTCNADGTGARRLTTLAEDGKRMPYGSYLRPRISPDGRWVIFAYAERPKPCEVWIVSAKGGDARSLTVGNPMNWTRDGTGILFVRNSQAWKLDLITGKEEVAHPAKLPVDGSAGYTVGTIREDLTAAIFRSSRTNEYFDFRQGKTVKAMGGCESRFTIDGKYVYFVRGPKDFRVWDPATDKEHEILGTPAAEPYNYTYCPTVSADNRWILYGASPGQHDHATSDYEIYIHELRDLRPVGEPVRLSFNSRCDRWPNLWLGPKNGLPDGPYDVAGNRLVNPPPPPLMVFSFARDGDDPDIGGDWGLWPQVEGCRGEATWVDGDDAQGRDGGSMRLEYTIEQDPKSFSLWISPGTVDLSAYDRIVVYAKGDVPSFTLVIKDENQKEPEDPDGIADCTVKGINGQWQRLELAFSDFVPRKAGGKVDWRRINHFGIAMIAPDNAESGTLQVDNLQAIPKGAG